MKIVKTKNILVNNLSYTKKTQLLEELKPIVKYWFNNHGQEEMLNDMIIRSGKNFIKLLYDNSGSLVGFCSIGIQKLNLSSGAEIVFGGGTFTMPGVIGARWEAVKYGLKLALLERLQHPFLPISMVTFLSTPASYIATYDSFQDFYPKPDKKNPKAVSDLLAKIAAARKQVIKNFDPFIVCPKKPISLKKPQKLKNSNKLNHRYEFQWFCKANPGYEHGDYLAAYIPFGIFELIKITYRKLRATLQHRRTSLWGS